MTDWLSERGYGIPTLDDEYDLWKRVVSMEMEDEGRQPTAQSQSRIRAVFTFTRFDGSPGGDVYPRRIQLIIVHDDPIEFITFDFHSSESTSIVY